ncbi:hypothetical protein HB943_05750 [Listeria weihenstephanensis]|uniref:YqgU-like 6-bladed beta-propeller domain-containing protein n=1 Tax=Listeria weihenstephanensis TaxID=1006155 RepID=A0A841Z637_9LIST|nr:hypothetical protein [Listeria weihenstephanensis]MBC1500102.1 hypothetical protein [Listeria weihenstephanensis]
MNKMRIGFIITILGLLFFSYGCKNEETAPGKKKEDAPVAVQTSTVNSKEFQRVIGWVDDENVLLQLKKPGKITFETLNILTNKRKKIYETKNVISEVQISPDRDRFLVYSTSSKDKAVLDVISMAGTPLFTKSIKPQNIEFAWNHDNPDKMFMTTFDTDWNYQVFQWDIPSGSITKLDATSPFVSWYSDNLFVVNQKASAQNDRGDIFLEDIRDKSVKNLIVANVYQFAVSSNIFLTMEPGETEKSMVYNFRSIGFQSYYKYEAPRVYDELGTFFPFYDLNVDQESFLTFEPYESKKLNDHGGEFKLVKIDPKTKHNDTILELVNNEPILTSPSGKYCLYGYLFDRVVDLESGDMTYLIPHRDKIY